MNHAMLSRKTAAAPELKTTPKAASGSLRIGEPNDSFEQEADRVADEIMSGGFVGPRWSLARSGFGQSLQRKCGCGRSVEMEDECDECAEKKMLQRKASGSSRCDIAPPIVHEVLRSPGRPLDHSARAFFEPRFGFDFSRVRIHADSSASQSAQAVASLAYTVGNDIVFASNRYRPETNEGRRLLAHELAHVVHQRGTSERWIQREDDETESLVVKANRALQDGNIPQAAELANGLSPSDLQFLLGELNESQKTLLHDNAVINGKLGPNSQIAKVTHYAYLNTNYQKQMTQGGWGAAAEFLNGFSPKDIQARLGKLKPEQLTALQQGAVANSALGAGSNAAKFAAEELARRASKGDVEAVAAVKAANAPAPTPEERKKACEETDGKGFKVFPLELPGGLWQYNSAPITATQSGNEVSVSQPQNEVQGTRKYRHETRNLPQETFTKGGLRLKADDVVGVRIYEGDNKRLKCVTANELLKFSEATDNAILASMVSTALEAASFVAPGAGRVGQVFKYGIPVVTGGVQAASQYSQFTHGVHEKFDPAGVAFDTVLNLLLAGFGPRLNSWTHAKLETVWGQIPSPYKRMGIETVVAGVIGALPTAGRALFEKMRGQGTEFSISDFVEAFLTAAVMHLMTHEVSDKDAERKYGLPKEKPTAAQTPGQKESAPSGSAKQPEAGEVATAAPSKEKPTAESETPAAAPVEVEEQPVASAPAKRADTGEPPSVAASAKPAEVLERPVSGATAGESITPKGHAELPAQGAPKRAMGGAESRPPGEPPGVTVERGTAYHRELRANEHEAFVKELQEKGLGKIELPEVPKGPPLAAGTYRDSMTSPHEALRAYHEAKALAPGLEVGLWRELDTGLYYVVVGSERGIGPPAGAGYCEAVIHFHPIEGNILGYRMASVPDVENMMKDSLQLIGRPVTQFVEHPLPGGGVGRMAVTVEVPTEGHNLSQEIRITPDTPAKITVEFVDDKGVPQTPKPFNNLREFQEYATSRTMAVQGSDHLAYLQPAVKSARAAQAPSAPGAPGAAPARTAPVFRPELSTPVAPGEPGRKALRREPKPPVGTRAGRPGPGVKIIPSKPEPYGKRAVQGLEHLKHLEPGLKSARGAREASATGTPGETPEAPVDRPRPVGKPASQLEPTPTPGQRTTVPEAAEAPAVKPAAEEPAPKSAPKPESEPPAKAGEPAPASAAVSKPMQALEISQTGTKFSDEDMVKTRIEEAEGLKPAEKRQPQNTPNMDAVRASLKQQGAALEPEPGMFEQRQEAAAVAYIQVTGPDGSSFSRAVIHYEPKIAVLQDLKHEMNHLIDFQAGKMPPSRTITAPNAERFAELQAKSPPELLAIAESMPKGSPRPRIEGAKQYMRKFVAETRNHLRDIEALRGAKDSSFVKNAREAAEGFPKVIKRWLETGANGALNHAETQELKQYVRDFINTNFPELRSAHGAMFPEEKDVWKFLD